MVYLNDICLNCFVSVNYTFGFARNTLNNRAAGTRNVSHRNRFEIDSSGHHIAFFYGYRDRQYYVAIIFLSERGRYGVVAQRRRSKIVRGSVDSFGYGVTLAVFYVKIGDFGIFESGGYFREFIRKINRVAENNGLRLHNAAHVIEINREILVTLVTVIEKSPLIVFARITVDCLFRERKRSPGCRLNENYIRLPLIPGCNLVRVSRSRGVNVNFDCVVNFYDSPRKFGIERVRRPLVTRRNVYLKRFFTFYNTIGLSRFAYSDFGCAGLICKQLRFEILRHGSYERFAYLNGYLLARGIFIGIGSRYANGIITRFIGRKAVIRNRNFASVLVFNRHGNFRFARIVAYDKVGNVSLARRAFNNRAERNYRCRFVFYFYDGRFRNTLTVTAIGVIGNSIIAHKLYGKLTVGQSDFLIAVLNRKHGCIIVGAVVCKHRRNAIFAADFYRYRRSDVHSDIAVIVR